jgi:hypothetical protein
MSAMSLADLTREAVLAALREHDDLGRAAFLTKYGLSEAGSYFVVHGDKRYDSTAVARAAHGFLPGQKALSASESTGGEQSVKARLTKLGFVVEGPPREPRYWAFFANPRIYRIDGALRSLAEDRWVTAGKDVRQGDRVLIWRGLGADHRRGVVALGEVMSDPSDLDDSANPF